MIFHVKGLLYCPRRRNHNLTNFTLPWWKQGSCYSRSFCSQLVLSGLKARHVPDCAGVVYGHIALVLAVGVQDGVLECGRVCGEHKGGVLVGGEHTAGVLVRQTLAFVASWVNLYSIEIVWNIIQD